MRSRLASALGASLALCATAAMGACQFIESIFAPAAVAPRPFNHAVHVDEGMECKGCHKGTDKEAKAGMPTQKTCMKCHEETEQDPKRPPEKKVGWFLDENGDPQWSAFTRQSEEIQFSHRAHVTQGVECTACHAGIDKSKGLLPDMLLRMDSCLGCHSQRAPGRTDCATCHTVINRDAPPPSHAMLWKRLHGQRSRQGRDVATSNDCSMCHQNDACITCHQTQRPDDHNAAWRFRPHGIAASIDRSRCAVCHQSDACARCHEETAPRSHTAGWNAPRNQHCMSCHLPLPLTDTCSVCHKTTPGHDLAPPKPAWHGAGMVCRSCHAASLPHPDNGDDCNLCHR